METFFVSVVGVGRQCVEARGFVDALERVLPATEHPRQWSGYGIDRETHTVAAEWDVGEAREHRVRVEWRQQHAVCARCPT